MKIHNSIIFFSLLVSPVILLRLIVSIYPNFSTLYLSFTNTDLLERTNDLVGLKNYFKFYFNPNSIKILSFSIIFVFLSTFMQVSIGFLIALLLNINSKIKNLLRTISLIPWAVPMIVVGYTFSWLLNDQFGLINLFNPFWDEKPLIFLSPTASQITVILVNIWKTMPFVAILLLAGLQGVQSELIDASKVDGANNFQVTKYIIIPAILPLAIVISILLLVSQFGNFDVIFAMTQGGPGVSTQILALQIFNDGMLFFKFGYAAAESVILLIFVIIISLIGTSIYSLVLKKYA